MMNCLMVGIIPTLILSQLFVFSESYVFRFGGSGKDYCNDIAVDGEENLVVTGSTESWGAIVENVLISSAWNNGTIRWISSFGTAVEENVYMIKVLSDGNYIIVGRTGTDPDYEPFIAKVNSKDGSIIFQTKYPNTNLKFRSLEEDSPGNIYAIGYHLDSPYWEVYVMKYDSGGNYITNHAYYESSKSVGFGVESFSTSDGIYIFGYSPYFENPGYYDPIVLKIQYDLSLDFFYAFGYTNDHQIALAGIVPSMDPSYYVFVGYDTEDYCIFLYKVSNTPTAAGRKICWAGHQLYAYDVMEDKQGDYIIVGMDNNGTTTLGIIVKVKKTADSVIWFRSVPYFARFTSIANHSLTTYVSGRTSDYDCAVARLEPDETLCGIQNEELSSLTITPVLSIVVTTGSATPYTYSLSSSHESPNFLPFITEIDQTFSCFKCFGVEHDQTDLVCSQHGSCVDIDSCDCQTNYSSSICDEWKCFDVLNTNKSVCNQGNCTSPNYCECDYQKSGRNCEFFNCFGISGEKSNEVCSGNGKCVNYNDCFCNKNYTAAKDCSVWECFGFLNNDTNEVCNGHGNCTFHDNCQCNLNYSSDDCGKWYCNNTEKSEVDVCNGRGNCTAKETCLCDTNYSGKYCSYFECFGIGYNETTRVCSNHGKCISNNNCVCENNYTSASDCSIWKCFGIYSNETGVCHQNGNCSFYDNCECKKNYSSYDCGEWYCNSTEKSEVEVCNNRGNCTSHETCICDTYYSGQYCDYFECFGIGNNISELVCSTHGTCLSHDVCDCGYNYTESKDCSIWECFGKYNNDSSVCSFSNGNCSSHDQCQCRTNYSSYDCSKWYCNNTEKSEVDVCNGRGNCSSSENCECDNTYYSGEYCDFYTCYDIGKNETDRVCNGHGECIAHNNCSCHVDYPGTQCDIWSCWGSAIHSTACEEFHGVCVDWNVCWCFPGYSSLTVNGKCTEWQCGTHHKDDDLVCNQRGDCIASQNCECRGDFVGSYCETWECGNIDYKLDVSCSGHGKCLAPNKCECSTGFTGELCETNTLYYSVMTPILSVFGLSTLAVILLIAFCLICCFLCCTCVILCGIISLFFLSGTVLFQKFRMKKFGKLKNIDILIREQELEEDESVAHLKIDKKLFEIPYKEISMDSVIGEGGSNSIVYKATWRKRIVAFKCFRTRSVCSSQTTFSEFETEMAILSSVNHPNIIRCFGGVLQPPRVGIVMEYCENGDLVRFIMNFMKRMKMMNSSNEEKEEEEEEEEEECWLYPLEEKIRMIHEIASSMDYLHARKILHRDLKMENVLVDTMESCKLMDFGLSRVVERVSQNKTKKIGTNIYMSPEIMLSGKYDEKTDVFSFGILMFILISQNFYPYGRGEQFVEVRVSQDPGFRPNIEELDSILSTSSSIEEEKETFEKNKWIKNLVVSCWEHEPKVRKSFESILELIEENTVVSDAIDEFDGNLGEGEEEGGIKKPKSKSLTMRTKMGRRSSGRERQNSSSSSSSSIRRVSDFRKKKKSKSTTGPRFKKKIEMSKGSEDSSVVPIEEFEALMSDFSEMKKKNAILRRKLFTLQSERDRFAKKILKESDMNETDGFLKRSKLSPPPYSNDNEHDE